VGLILLVVFIYSYDEIKIMKVIFPEIFEHGKVARSALSSEKAMSPKKDPKVIICLCPEPHGCGA